jgi:hypothetical protein
MPKIKPRIAERMPQAPDLGYASSAGRPNLEVVPDRSACLSGLKLAIPSVRGFWEHQCDSQTSNVSHDHHDPRRSSPTQVQSSESANKPSESETIELKSSEDTRTCRPLVEKKDVRYYLGAEGFRCCIEDCGQHTRSDKLTKSRCKGSPD